MEKKKVLEVAQSHLRLVCGVGEKVGWEKRRCVENSKQSIAWSNDSIRIDKTWLLVFEDFF